VETYLDVSGNVVAACELLFVHRTTLYYRLEKMPPVVREALADGMKRSTLHLSLKLIRMWEATGRL
jgi:DNA-binding PucR family transcriptional regulator